MFKTRTEARPVEIFPGVVRRTLTNTERAMLTEVTVKKGSGASTHTHAQDEIGYVTSGRVRVRTGAEWHDAGPGDTYCAPGNEPHELEALEDSVCIVVFAPVRPEYMD